MSQDEALKIKMKKDFLNKLFRSTIGFMFFLASLPTLAAIPYRNSAEEMDAINAQTNELNLDVFARMQAVIDKMKFKPENYIPTTGMPEYATGDKVSAKILQKTVQTLIDSNQQNAAFHEVHRYTSNYEQSVTKNNCKMGFNLNSTRAKAEISYAKYVSATLTYDVIQPNGMKVEVSHPLTASSVLAYTHGNGALGGVEDKLGVRWSF